MPRNGTGIFAIINPVVVGRLRSSSAINQNLEDAGAQITNTLPLDGTAAMIGQFKAAPGIQTAPGITFALDRNTGFRRRGPNEMAWVSGGADRFYIDANGKAWQAGAMDVAGGLNVPGEFTGTNDAAAIEALGEEGPTTGLARRTGTNLWALDDGTTPIFFLRDGKGTVLPTGIMGDRRIPYGCTIVGATLLADQVGSALVEIWKAPLASYPPTVSNSIGSLTLTADDIVDDSVLAGWTTAIAAGDVLRYNISSISSIKRLAIILRVKRFT